MRILCVCLGNICRSPTAEAVLRQMGGDRIQVDSAGTSDWHIGNPPYWPAIAAAAKRGYDLEPLRARQFTARDFETFDLILAMDRKNLNYVDALRPNGNTTAVCLFLDFAPETGVAEVPDPYYTQNFDEALELIEAAARKLVDGLK